MTPSEVQQLHTDMLRLLNAVGEIGIREDDLLTRMRVAAYPQLTAPELRTELRAIADRGLAVAYQPALGAQRWKLTGLGLAALKEVNLA